ncbi:retrovirus-related Pol polyprotein from transposon TNT 1-94 [Trichinella spiralis]|uniref:retrovirus-related Pol polyprotein from transposon TNT 1-94 n=1 Tax=Trichinella spiralis TaxID=6334 RepID=UPI0001EFC8B3|nr:retrovirus-related Pol polyprotein from transposon TNT 1-94 [Trichinella spiralis]
MEEIYRLRECGVVKIPLATEKTMVAHDVRHAPELALNLLSVSRIAAQKKTLIFDEYGCRIVDIGVKVLRQHILGTAMQYNGLYQLNRCDHWAMAMQDIPDLWHRRLGHLSRRSMKLLQDGQATGIPSDAITKTDCVTCLKGKKCRSSFSKLATKRSKDVLELVHSGICGPLQVAFVGGARYFLSFIDDFSRKSFVYFLKHKNEALPKFKDFIALVERQTSNGFEKDVGEEPVIVWTPRDGGLTETPKVDTDSDESIVQIPQPSAKSSPEELRRPLRNRIPNRNIFNSDFLLFQAQVREQSDPISYEEAVNRPDAMEWLKAINEELASHCENQSWEPAVLPPHKKPSKINGSSKRSIKKMGRLRNEKRDLWPKYTHNCKELTMKTQCPTAEAPLDPNQVLSNAMMLRSDGETKRMHTVPYREAVRCLVYLSQSCDPDICQAVGIYTKSGKVVYKRTENALTVYSDADWANDRDDRRSISGCVVCHSSAVIAWSSKKQRTVALSTTEAEYMALSHAAQETAWPTLIAH